ncbi:hypothetical protein E3P77_01032 [Wallemia ichthyophaga]|nr:hypothetical protein E3P77_01032 [Wallemia ichthyophaga]
MSTQFLSYADSSNSPNQHLDAVWHTRWTANAVLSASNDGFLNLWDGSTAEHKARLDISHLSISSLSTTPHPECPQRALVSSIDGTTSVVSLADAHLSASTSHPGIWKSAIHPITLDHYTTSPAKLDSKLSIHSANIHPQSSEDPDFGTFLGTYDMGKPAFILSLEYSPNGAWCVAGAQSGQTYVFDTKSGSLVRVLTTHSKPVRSISFSPDSSILYTSSDDRLISAVDLRASTGSGAVFSFSNAHESSVTAVSAAPDSRLLASASTDHSIRLFDIGQRASVAKMAQEDEVWSLSWRPLGVSGLSGSAFASGGDSGVVKWWKSAG